MDLGGLIRRHTPWVVFAAAAAPLVACAALSAFRNSVTAATSVLLLVLLVVAAASTGVRTAGVVAALSGGVWFDVFLTQPYGRLTIDDSSDVLAAVLLVLIGAAVSEIALWGRRQQARADRRAGYLEGVLGAAEIVALRGATSAAFVDHVAEQIRQVLGVARCRFVAGPVRDSRIPVLDHGGVVTRGDHRVNVDRDGLPFDDETALPVTLGDQTVGHFLVTAAADIARPTSEQRKVAVLLADQTRAVLAHS
jgi:K+-sensing histidine kinase KdpD